MSLAVVYSRAQDGIAAPLVSCEVHLSGGLPGTSIVGLAETAVKEARDRVRAAILNAQLEWPQRKVTVNLAPADLPKDGGYQQLCGMDAIHCILYGRTSHVLKKGVQLAQVVAISLDIPEDPASGVASQTHRLATAGFPQLAWGNGAPWREANVWLLSRRNAGLEAATLRKDAQLVGAYAKWVEDANLPWHHFPLRKDERVLNRYRQHLLHLRASGKLAASTATHRMRAVISLYRWLVNEQLLSTTWPLWQDRTFGVRITTDFGLQRSINVTSSSLAIKNKRRPGYRLEDGVLPVSATLRTQILEAARSYAPPELFLMLACGFFTGMRIGSICDLRVGTLNNVARDSKLNGFVYLVIGPGATPQVHTKFGVTGQVLMPTTLFEELLGYVESPVRLKRVKRAVQDDQDRVFLTKAGRSYGGNSLGHGATVRVLLSRLRRDAARFGLDLGRFYFHQTRATFATEVAETALRSGLRLNAISIVKDLLLHAHEATSLRYIRFVEDERVKVKIGDDFSRAFLNEALTASSE